MVLETMDMMMGMMTATVMMGIHRIRPCGQVARRLASRG